MKIFIVFRKITLIFLSLTIGSYFCHAQKFSLKDKKNFYDLLKDYYATYKDTPRVKDKPGGEETEGEGGLPEIIKEMDRTWSPRLFPSGNCKLAANAIVNYAQNYRPTTSTYTPNWTCLGPHDTPLAAGASSLGTGQIQRITFDPQYDGSTNRIVYASSSFGGLWKSTNAGSTWQIANTDQLPLTNVADVAVNSQNSSMVFIATGLCDVGFNTNWGANWGYINPLNTIGIYRSTNNTQTWQPINNGFLCDFTNGGTVRRLISDPNNPNYLYAATTNGIYQTANATDTYPQWTNVFNGLPGTPDVAFRGLEIQPGNSSTIYASGQDIYVTYDQGQTWASMTGLGTGLDLTSLPNNFSVNKINIAVTPADPHRLYAYIQGSRDPDPGHNNTREIYIYEYRSGSLPTWTQLYSMSGDAGGSTQTIADGWMAFAASPINADQLYFGDTQVYGSIDITSAPFTIIAGYFDTGFHADVHGLAFEPHVTNPKLFCGHDGGISTATIATNGHASWNLANVGLENSTIWSFDNAESNKDEIFISTQDDGNIASYRENGNLN